MKPLVFHPQNETEWLALRETRVGASELSDLIYLYEHEDGTTAYYTPFDTIPATARKLFCVSRFGSYFSLWMKKAGRVAPENLDDNERILTGKIIEPAIASLAEMKWGWKLRRVKRYYVIPCGPYPDRGIGVSRDYEMEAPGYPPVETKSVDTKIFYRDFTFEGEEIIDAPFYHMMQVQAQIACTGSDHGYLVCFVGGNRMARMRIDRNDAAIERLVWILSQFWQAIHDGVAPRPEDPADWETVKRMYEGVSDGAVYWEGRNDIDRLCENYLEAKAQLKELNEETATIRAQIVNEIKELECVMTPLHRINYKADRQGVRRFIVNERTLNTEE